VDFAIDSPRGRLAIPVRGKERRYACSYGEILFHMPLRVLTYNVNFALARRGRDSNAQNVINAIKESNADVVALQETHAGFEKLLREDFSEIYPYQLYHHDARGGAGGQAFLSKMKFGQKDVIHVQEEIEGSWFPVHVVDVLLPGDATQNGTEKLRLINVHLRPPVNPDGSAHILTARNTNKFRLAEVKRIAEHVQWHKKPELPTIILGDFNENDGAPALSWLQANFGFVDALHEFVPQNRETHRWRILWGYWLLLKRLDHLLYSNMNCHSCQVIDGYEENASDHQPVLGEFSFL